MSDANGVMMQYFHWYSPDDGTLWDDVSSQADALAQAGFTALWLPPAYKGIGGSRDVGYGVYDLYDLGEFEQKGSIRTKYGTRQQYLQAIAALHAAGVQVYADAVLNHRIGGDATETTRATPFLQDDRLHPRGEPREVEVYTQFTFPGRRGQYSPFEWHWQHFDAVDYDARTQESNRVYLFEGKQFDDQVALEKGNFAYLMGCDLDFQNEEVRAELTRWGQWYLDTTGVDGFRLDAVKHISASRVGWTRLGDAEHPKAMAVLLSDGIGGGKWMEVGKPNAKFVDLTEHVREPVYTNDAGWGEFQCQGGSVSVWIEE